MHPRIVVCFACLFLGIGIFAAEGTKVERVLVEFVVNGDGRPTNITIVEATNERLATRAINAVSRWQLDKKYAGKKIRQPIEFAVEDESPAKDKAGQLPGEILSTAAKNPRLNLTGEDRGMLEYDIDKDGKSIGFHSVKAAQKDSEIAALSENALDFLANSLPDQVFVNGSATERKIAGIRPVISGLRKASPVEFTLLPKDSTVVAVRHGAVPFHVASEAHAELLLNVDPRGRVVSICVLSEDDKTWANNCIAAASRFEFLPTMVQGKAVSVLCVQPFICHYE